MDKDQEFSQNSPKQPKKKFSVTFGALIIFIATFLILAIVGYKYNEYKTLNKFVKLYNSTWEEELKIVEGGNKNFIEFSNFLDEESTKSSELLADNLNSLDKSLVFVKLELNNNENYINTLENNKKKYANDPLNEKLIFGKKGDFINSLREAQLLYYDKEINNAKENEAFSGFLHDSFLADKDYWIQLDYNQSGSKPESYYVDNFFAIKSLEKYTDKDHKFAYEDKYKDLNPKAYEAMNNYRKYFSTYYSMMKDYITGDDESYNYKTVAYDENYLKLGYDLDEIIDESYKTDDYKDVVDIVGKQTILIKNFEDSKGLKYPLVSKVNDFEEDMVACQLYIFKSGTIYEDVKDKYPDAENIDELLKELSQISPKTDELDKRFDKKSMAYDNQEDKINITCKNSKGFSFTDTRLKENEEDN